MRRLVENFVQEKQKCLRLISKSENSRISRKISGPRRRFPVNYQSDSVEVKLFWPVRRHSSRENARKISNRKFESRTSFLGRKRGAFHTFREFAREVETFLGNWKAPISSKSPDNQKLLWDFWPPSKSLESCRELFESPLVWWKVEFFWHVSRDSERSWRDIVEIENSFDSKSYQFKLIIWYYQGLSKSQESCRNGFWNDGFENFTLTILQK